jgi:hypothetical protein
LLEHRRAGSTDGLDLMIRSDHYYAFRHVRLGLTFVGRSTGRKSLMLDYDTLLAPLIALFAMSSVPTFAIQNRPNVTISMYPHHRHPARRAPQ